MKNVNKNKKISNHFTLMSLSLYTNTTTTGHVIRPLGRSKDKKTWHAQHPQESGSIFLNLLEMWLNVDCVKLRFLKKGGNTTGMKRHLENIHDININLEIDQPKHKKAKSNEEGQHDNTAEGDSGDVHVVAGPSQKQQPLTFFMRRTDRLSETSTKSKNITQSIAKMIFTDLQPLSVVEDAGFRDAIGYASDNRYVMPSRKSLRYNIIPTLYNQCAAKVSFVNNSSLLFWFVLVGLLLCRLLQFCSTRLTSLPTLSHIVSG